jgi:4'-phosphopantetheinyl transferase EntD
VSGAPGAPGAFAIAFARDLPFGRCVGVTLPLGDDGPARLPALHPDEAAHALALPVARRATWVGGRVALRAALADLGIAATGPILATARGAPALPAGAAGSVSHKRSLAVALAAREVGGGASLGIDVEVARGLRDDIGSRVLAPEERARVDALPDGERARELLVAFSAKEAIYKALDPHVTRYVSFHEVALDRDGRGQLRATLRLRQGEGPYRVDVHEEPLDGFVLIAAQVVGESPG